MTIYAPSSTWSVAEAKARLSEVLERAHSYGPQRIARRGKRPVVVVPEADWLAATGGADEGGRSIVEFFRASRLAELGLSELLDREEASRQFDSVDGQLSTTSSEIAAD